MGCHFFLQGNFLIQGLNPRLLHLLHWQVDSLPLSHLGSPCLVHKEVLVTQLCPTLCDPMDCSPPGSSVHEIFQAKDTGVDCHFLLQGIFPTQGLNPGLLHCRLILYRLSYKGSLVHGEFTSSPSGGACVVLLFSKGLVSGAGMPPLLS